MTKPDLSVLAGALVVGLAVALALAAWRML